MCIIKCDRCKAVNTVYETQCHDCGHIFLDNDSQDDHSNGMGEQDWMDLNNPQ